MIGLGITAIYVLMALFGSAIAPHNLYQQDLDNKLAGFTWAHPLGRDELGRDMLSRLLYGSKYSLGMALAVVLIGLTVGTALGSISGFFGGRLDTVIMRIVDAQMAFPGLLVAIAIVSILGPGFKNLIIAMSVGSFTGFTRLIRVSFLTLREDEFVTAARAIGVSDFRIILRHILPNCMAPILVQATYRVAGTMLGASGLSFLGLGAQPPTPEWGVMLSRGRGYMRLAPHVVTIPGLAIAIAILGLNLLGDGLRDILDPRLID